MRYAELRGRLIVFSLILLASSGFAQEKSTQLQKASGKIDTINVDKNSMRLQTKEGKTLTFDLSPTTKVTMPGSNTAKIRDIEPGDSANILYKTDGTKRVVLSVEVIGSSTTGTSGSTGTGTSGSLSTGTSGSTASRPGGCPEGQPCPDDDGTKTKTKK